MEPGHALPHQSRVHHPRILSELKPPSSREICVNSAETYTTASTDDRHNDIKARQLKHWEQGLGLLGEIRGLGDDKEGS